MLVILSLILAGGLVFLVAFTWQDITLSNFEGGKDFTEDEFKTTLANDVGFLGDVIGTRIKLLPTDFITCANANDQGEVYIMKSAGFVGGAALNEDGHDFIAIVPIPTGYKATAVMVYAQYEKVMQVFEGAINTKTSTQLGEDGVTNTELDISADPLTADTTNYLVIFINRTGSGDQIYGGYVTIAKI